MIESAMHRDPRGLGSPRSGTAPAGSVPDALGRLAVRFGLLDLYVLGSRSEEAARVVEGCLSALASGGSDLDVAVRFDPALPVSARERSRLAAALEDLFGAGRVDLVDLGRADPFLAVEAIRGRLLYCRDALDQAEYELYVLRRAADLDVFRRRRVQAVLAEGAR